LEVGVFWRLILMMTDLSAITLNLSGPQEKPVAPAEGDERPNRADEPPEFVVPHNPAPATEYPQNRQPDPDRGCYLRTAKFGQHNFLPDGL
jgi:hypothetical protein